MRWLFLFAVLLAFAGAFAAGLWAGRRGRRFATVAIAVCLVPLLVRVALPPTLEFALLPFDLYAVLRPWWPIPFGLALLAAAAPHAGTPRAGHGLLALAALAALVMGQRLLATVRLDPARFEGTVGADGVCLQSTGFSCGAAAAATLLAHHGVAASEGEMAGRCWTNTLTGTDPFCVARGLRQKLAGTGRVVRFHGADWEALRRRTEPAMATIRWGVLVDHWVVVRATREDAVVVADPVRGEVVLSRDEFLAVWRRSLVTADRTE